MTGSWTQHTRMRIAWISVIVYAGATVTYGLVADDRVRLVLGAGLLALLIAGELLSRHVNPTSAPRRLLALATTLDRGQRLVVIAFVVAAVVRAIQCLVAFAQHDWSSLVYFTVTALALAGMLGAVSVPLAVESVDHDDGCRGSRAAP